MTRRPPRPRTRRLFGALPLLGLVVLASVSGCGNDGPLTPETPSAGGRWNGRTAGEFLLLTLREYDDSSITGTGYVIESPAFHSSFATVSGDHFRHPEIVLQVSAFEPDRVLRIRGEFVNDSTIVGSVNDTVEITLRREGRAVPKG